jgi:hypothetical protein
VSLLDSMDINNMDDTGMWLWATLLAVAGLAISLAIAIGWQRWRDAAKKKRS